MKRKEIIEATIERMDFPNIGITHYEDNEIKIKLALPGQKVKMQIQKARKEKATARLLEVLERSEYETVEKMCPHDGICGGCLYGGFPYEKELELKHEQIRRLFVPILGEKKFSHIDEGILASPKALEYRNKMEFTFGDSYKDGPLALGMHKRGSFYDIETVEHCQIVDEDFRRILKASLEYFASTGTSFFHRMRHEGYLRHLLVRKATNTKEILVCLVTSTQTDSLSKEEQDLLEGFKKSLLSLSLEGTIQGILHTKNDRLADLVEDQGTTILYGSSYFTERLLGLSFQISPFSFFQTNSKGAEALYELVRDYLPKTANTLYDLYSGTGTIAQIMAPSIGTCIGVEIVPEAVEAAKENAKDNHLDNCYFISGDVLKELDSIKSPPDVIVLDPPREGVHPKALAKILSYGVEHIVYISCKATSLARDLPLCQAHGYEPQRMKVVDLFPRTGNMEVVMLLSKSDGKTDLQVVQS